MDVLTPEQRKFNMSRIRGKDTCPEMAVRSLVRDLNHRYRLHVRALPGCPDLVLVALRKVIFVHGCFWHRHRCKYGRPVPGTRTKFWKAKFAANKARDIKSRRALRKQGWDVLVIWECQTRRPEWLRVRLAKFLSA